MADDVDNIVECALENLISVTEKSGNLRNDLKQLILKSVSSLRNAFIELKTSIVSNNDQNIALNTRVKEMEEKVKDLEDLRRSSAVHVAPSSALSRDYPPVGTFTRATYSGAQKKLFSEAVASAAQKAEKRYKLMVSSKLKESAESVKTILKSKIDPTSIQVGIKTFKSMKDGRVLIETGSKEEIEVLNETINNCCSQTLEAKVSKLRNPNIIIYNIPNDINKDNAKEIIIAQNTELAIQEEDITPKFIFRNKKNNTNLVVEVTPQARKKLLERKIKLGWIICRAEDYIVPLKCFKCSRFHHKQTKCEGDLTCPLCTGGHNLKECTVPETEFKCINCITYNKYTKGEKICVNHSALTKTCPSYLAAIRKCIENTDY